jgi:hypothetical protein
VDVNASVVCDIAQLSKPVHELADPGTGSTNHLCKGLLCDRRNQHLWLSGIAKLRHQQECPRQTLFTVVEELVYEVLLGPDGSRQDELQEHFGELMLITQQTNHLFSVESEGGAGRYRFGCCGVKTSDSRQRLFSDKVMRHHERDCRFLPVLRYDDQLRAA